MESPLIYLTDPVLSAPTIGCMLMCAVSSLVGVIAFLRKQSLLGESLSHASYPGVIIGVLVASLVVPQTDYATPLVPVLILTGAFVGALMGLIAIHLLETRFRVRPDTALCFVLASFFGIGITIASRVQVTHTQLYRKIEVYLYGQAATMTDIHVYLYGFLTLLTMAIFALFYKEIQLISFDRDYAKSMGVSVKSVEALLYSLIVLAVVVGIRSVGVVLMSAMLIAPAVAARQYTHKLHWMLVLSVVFGLLSGFFGNYLSIEIGQIWGSQASGASFALPTGPMIVLCSTAICLFALLAAPERGLIQRILRAIGFRYQCLRENLLKGMWREDPFADFSREKLNSLHIVSPWLLGFTLNRLSRSNLVTKKDGNWKLTDAGRRRSAHIVRLHRLWELYLVDALGIGVKRVHCSAEEMEHIITPELEKRLSELLKNPTQDPHHQPIPPPIREC